MRVMGEVILRKTNLEVNCIKLRAAGYECKVVPPKPDFRRDEDDRFLMIWRDYPDPAAAWNRQCWMQSPEACTAMTAFCADVDDVIEGPHDDGRMEDPSYVGVVQGADFVAAGFIPVCAGDYGD
jgi:hypothetical protein